MINVRKAFMKRVVAKIGGFHDAIFGLGAGSFRRTDAVSIGNGSQNQDSSHLGLASSPSA